MGVGVGERLWRECDTHAVVTFSPPRKVNADITWVQVIWTDSRHSNSPRPVLLTFECQATVVLLLLFILPLDNLASLCPCCCPCCSSFLFFFLFSSHSLLEDGRLPQAFYPPFKRDQALPRLFTHCQASTLQVRPLFWTINVPNLSAIKSNLHIEVGVHSYIIGVQAGLQPNHDSCATRIFKASHPDSLFLHYSTRSLVNLQNLLANTQLAFGDGDHV